MEAVIYALIDPRVDDDIMCVRYVGKSRCIIHRLSEHRYQAKIGTDTYLYHWYNKLLSEGVEPVLVVIRNVSKKLSGSWEKAYIKKFKSLGAKLVNLTAGGDGSFGHVMSDETKRKISEAKKGIKYTEEQKKRMGAPKRGRKFSDEHRRKLSEAGKGRPVSKETREKVRKANKGHQLTEEQRVNFDAAMKDRVGVKRPPEFGEAVRQANLKRQYKPHTEETKRKISDSLYAAHDRKMAAKAAALTV